MIRAAWRLHKRHTVAAVVAVVVFAAGAGWALAVLPGTSRRQATGRPAPTVAARHPGGRRRVARAGRAAGPVYRPHYIAVPQTVRQREWDSRLAREESPGAIAELEALRVPAGGYSAAYPPIPRADTTDEIAFADAWVTEALNIDFRSQSRAGLLAWAVAGEAANTLPGVPADVAGKALYASLTDPALSGTTAATVVPTVKVWAADAKQGALQRVGSVTASVDPAWTRLVSAGFVARDPLLAVMDVTGTLSLRRPHQPTSTEKFELKLTVGSALGHPGYGAVSANDWAVRAVSR